MVSSFISRLVILVFGTLYPAYASYKAVRTKNVKEYVKWMMYWIVFALFTCAETFTDLFLSFWFPFYYEIKIITVIYLLSPATKGSSILYRKFVHPVLIAREQEIDEYIAKAKEQGYHTMLNLGSKGVTYATSLIMQTAIKGGNGLVSQLKKSYSLSDLSEEKNRRQEGSEVDGSVRHRDDPRLVQRMPDQRRISGTNQEGLYFPEVDTIQRPIVPEDEHYYSRIPSYEEISSGYSSGDPMFTGAYSSRDPFYNDAKRTKGDALVRTGSLGGGSTRVRTKASGLPKRSSLSEGESTWAAMEPRESQNEPHNRFYGYPLTQSASLPFSFSTFHNLMRPEYQHIFGNIPPQHMFASVSNPSAFSYHIHENISHEVSGSNTTHGVCNTPGVVISEVESDGVNNLKEEFNISLRDSVSDKSTNDNEESVEIKQGTNNTKSVSEFQVNKDDGREDKTLETGDTKSENDDKTVEEMTCEREHSPKERSGKYNKKPAPVPPNDDINAKRTLEDEEELEFVTPNASPKLEKKFSHSSASIAEGKCSTAGKVKAEGKKETQPVEKTKNKSKTKKGDNISKKLHLPKMPFSFWHQKGGKHSSGSETSSVASADVASVKSEDKNDLEIFIPLKDDVYDKNDKSEVIEEPK